MSLFKVDINLVEFYIWFILYFQQDTYDELFSYDSHREKGTLYNLKQVFDHKAVTKNIMECFDKAEELLEFSTEGYVVLAAMSALGIVDITDVPEDFPSTIQDKTKLRDEIAKAVVNDVMELPNTKEVLNVSLDKIHDVSLHCICQRDIGGTMIYCCNSHCEKGSWFHLECLGITEDEVPENDWFCSDDCRNSKSEKGKKKKKKTVDKFHDGKYEYVCHLIWRGMNDMARHDAVKENDGPRMIRHWKFDMFEFFQKNHPKYFIFGHHLLLNLAGATSQRLQHSLLWERTVNVSGGRRKNIPKDLHCEHLNREYKQNSRTAGGQLTDETVNRYSQMLGIGKIIAKVFEEQVVHKVTRTRKHAADDRKADVKHMVKILQPQKLFQYEIGRVFKGFEDFKIVKGVRLPRKFKERLAKHQEKKACEKEIMELN